MYGAIRDHNRSAVLVVYRNLLRSTRIAFRDDEATLIASRAFARQEFRKNSGLDKGSKGMKEGSVEAQQAIEHAKGVAQILKENVVQGVQANPEENFKLNIHEHTERGDNETIRKLKGTTKSFSSMKN